MSLSNGKVSVKKVALSGTDQLARDSSTRYPSVSIVGGFVYAVGSFFAARSTSAVVAVLNVRERKWNWIPYPRTYYTSPRIFLYEDNLFMFCARDKVLLNRRRMSRFDLVLEQWSNFDTIRTGPGPGKRVYFSGDFLEKEKVFVVYGGKLNGVHLGDVHILNLREQRWVQPKIKGKPPQPRSLHGSCTYQGKVYYYGGWTRGRRCDDGLHVLTLTKGNTATWSTLKQLNLSLGLSSFALISLGELLVFCGGSPSQVHTGVHVYDTGTGELIEVPLERAKSKYLGYGLAGFKTPFANTIGLIGGNVALDDYVELSVSQ